jgi:hypothetical protein
VKSYRTTYVFLNGRMWVVIDRAGSAAVLRAREHPLKSSTPIHVIARMSTKAVIAPSFAVRRWQISRRR